MFFFYFIFYFAVFFFVVCLFLGLKKSDERSCLFYCFLLTVDLLNFIELFSNIKHSNS